MTLDEFDAEAVLVARRARLREIRAGMTTEDELRLRAWGDDPQAVAVGRRAMAPYADLPHDEYVTTLADLVMLARTNWRGFR